MFLQHYYVSSDQYQGKKHVSNANDMPINDDSCGQGDSSHSP
jgi:hypothetical protein